MSSVLIGIIGVVLFIGLALAGALYLGPGFSEASSASKAAADVHAANQIVDAIERQLTGSTSIPTSPVDQVGCYSTGPKLFFYYRYGISGS